MQKLQESVFSIIKTTSLSSAVFDFLQPTEDFSDRTPLGGILRDTKYGWLALGPKFCVVDIRNGLKVAAHTFGNGISNRITVTSVVEIPTPLTDNSQQLIISLECDNISSLICIFHINGSQILRCIQTDIVITELTVCDEVPNGPLMCFDGLVMAGTRRGEVLVFDLNRAILIQALRDISNGFEHLVRGEHNVANLKVLSLKLSQMHKIENQRNVAVTNDDHIAILLNEDSYLDGQFVFRNPDGTIRMKAKQSHIRVTVVQYVPQLGSLAVGYNFGAFQIWNLLNLELEFTSQVNVECLPVTQFGFQEPCDDPRAFCYLWVVFSVTDRFEEEEFPLAVMYSLTYQGKRVLDDGKGLYQEFVMATIRFQLELNAMENPEQFIGGRSISCHTYSIRSILGEEGEDTMLNLCQLIWECWGDSPNLATQHGMLLFDLDQWYKDQMPATYPLESNAFMSTARCPEVNSGSLTLDLRLDPASVSPYSHAMRLEEHFYPNSLQYNCIWLNTSEASILHTVGVQRQLVVSINAAGPSCLLSPAHLHAACRTAGLTPLYCDAVSVTPEDQRRYLLSVALEGRLSRFLKRCAHDWATGTHSGIGCTLPFLIDWSWKRAIELKENAKELTAPLFTSATLPDRNVVRCLEHSVHQLTQLTGLLDAVLTKCCNLVVPDALSEMEEKYKGIGTVSLYFQVVQWFVRVGLLPERHHSYNALPYPAHQLYSTYNKRRVKLHRFQDKTENESGYKSCPLLYIDQLIEHEFGGETVYQMWVKAGSECGGLYPPPSLYALLRLYLIPNIAEEHKHSLLLYLLLDYSMLYDDIRYEAVIRRLMQFPTMFGLSNTAIKATQAFWHLDHRDFDFALDQLQCLTGNTLSDWQHHVVLSSLLAQKKTQAALQYLHVRKPPPIQKNNIEINDIDKLEDWQSCCDLYLARGLVFEALDVIRMCVQNAANMSDKLHLLNFFYKGCRNTGLLSKVLQVTLLPFEEEVFINYLKDSNDPQTSDILLMYYLQQARFLEAQQYHQKIRSKSRIGDVKSTSTSTLEQCVSRASGVDAIVQEACSALPKITSTVARFALIEYEPQCVKYKPMSVYVQANSPRNTFTYKSSFIQDTIENASETWVNKPMMRKGMKRALNVEETPFICTPKTDKTISLLSEQQDTEATPPKRLKLNLSGTPRTKATCTLKVSETLSRQMASFLDMPEVETPHKNYERSGAETPHSILKNRRSESRNREAPSPVDSRYLGDSDEEMETASCHTHYSDSKHLRFTIPTSSEAGSTPSPVAVPLVIKEEEIENDVDEFGHRASPMSNLNLVESPPKKFAAEEYNPKKIFKDSVRARKSLTLSMNSSLSDDPNSSVETIADLPVTLINPRYSGEKHRKSPTPIREEINREEEITRDEMEISRDSDMEGNEKIMPSTPQGRRSIRCNSDGNRSHSATPDRMDSPTISQLRSTRPRSRSRTPEILLSPTPLDPIDEQPKEEADTAPHATVTLTVPRTRSRSRTPERLDKGLKGSPKLEPIEELPCVTERPRSPSRSLRSRSRTPERFEKESKESHTLEPIKELSCVAESPPGSPTRRSLRNRSRTPERFEKESKESLTLEPIKELPCATESPPGSPTRRSLRSRSRTPEIEITEQPVVNPRSLRSRSKTPEKLMSPKKESARNKKSLSRIVLEANTFAKTKQMEKMETETAEKVESFVECTPMKSTKDIPTFMDVTFSPIVNKSILASSAENSSAEDATSTPEKSEVKPLPAFTTFGEMNIEKSILQSDQSNINESNIQENRNEEERESNPLPSFTFDENIGKSILHSSDSNIESSVREELKEKEKYESTDLPASPFKLNESNFGKSILSSANSSCTKEYNCGNNDIEIKDCQSQETVRVLKEKEKIVEIEREINEIEGEMSDDCQVESDSEVAEESSDSSDENSSEEDEDEHEEEEEVDHEEEEEDAEVEREIDVITIDDSDESVEAANMIIDEHVPTPTFEVQKVEVQFESLTKNEQKTIDDNPINTIESKNEYIVTLNEMKDQDQNLSILTDDNSFVASESSRLNYSEEGKLDENRKHDEAVETGEVFERDDKKPMTAISEKKDVTAPLVIEDSTNPMNQTQNLSILTDDNSVLASESTSLTYSEECKLQEKKKHIQEAMETDQSDEIIVKPEAMKTSQTEDFPISRDIPMQEKEPILKQIDVVDAVSGQLPKVTDDESKILIQQEPMNVEESKEEKCEKIEEDMLQSSENDVTDKPTPRKRSNSRTKSEKIKGKLTTQVQETFTKIDIESTDDKELKVSDKVLDTEIKNIQQEPMNVEVSKGERDEEIKILLQSSEKDVTLLRKGTNSRTKSENIKGKLTSQAEESIQEKYVQSNEDLQTEIKNIQQESMSVEESKGDSDVTEKPALSRKRANSRTKSQGHKEKYIESNEGKGMITSDEVLQTEIKNIQQEPMNAEDSTGEKVEKIEHMLQNSDNDVTDKLTTSRKRANSSTKSIDSEPKTPTRQKRTQSKVSLKPETETKATPSENIGRTPSKKGTEINVQPTTMLTRRVSRELSINIEELNRLVVTPKRRTRGKKDYSANIETDSPAETTKEMLESTKEDTEKLDISTPQRRSTRSRKKKDDDHSSVTSESSVQSKAQKEVEQENEEKQVISTPRRRSTRSRSKKEGDNVSVASDSSVKSGAIKMGEEDNKARKGRKSILSSRVDLCVIPESPAEDVAVINADDDDAASVESHDSIAERINLLNKKNFEGSPDMEELSFDASRSRMMRAASETKRFPKPARIGSRSYSVDIATPESVDMASPRGRRASFSRAVEAIQRPKRRSFADQTSSPASGRESPATPTRRSRRVSNASDTSQTTPATATGIQTRRRVADKNKETKE